LTVPEGSSIPVRTLAELTVPLGSQTHDLARRDRKGEILLGMQHEYADMQVLVTYIHSGEEWDVPHPRLAANQLPNTLKKLQDGDPITIVLFGDSISAGWNASKLVNTAPFQPAYGELLVENLQKTYQSKVTFKNLSVSGENSAFGVRKIGLAAAENPGLVILAWGMNDSCQDCPAPTFVANLQAQMGAVRTVNPSAEFLLVASMLSNADWYIANPDAILLYRDAMKKLESEGAAVADVTSIWEAMLKSKSYLDLTGNGVNHPNDFGHRIYAQALSALLIDD
jgi:lysophospholipase L1-like esterase